MLGPYVILLVLPSVTAVAVGWAARRWVVAATVVVAGVACLYLVPVIGGTARHISPIFTGAIISGLTILPLIIWKPDVSVWTRMTAALATTFAAHFLFLQGVLASIP